MKFVPALSPVEAEAAFGGKFIALAAFPANEGGQGIVFRARRGSAALGSPAPLALKIYFPGSLTERTRREVDALRRLKCEALVKLYDEGQVLLRGHQCTYVATEFIEGEILSGIISRGPLAVRAVAKIARDVAIAVQILWRERIVHRDIKPQNIMVTKAGGAVLIDLGVARHLSLGSLTTVGKTWGTGGYMSPEHALALRQLSCKSDVFALGIVMQECLMGAHPVNHNQATLANGGIPTAGLGVAIPADFAGVIDAMLRRDSHVRPSPEQIQIALTPFTTL